MQNKNIISDDAMRIILDSISDGVFTVDHNWNITSFNQAAEKITGVSRDEAIGKQCCEVFRSNMCETDCALYRTMSKGRPFIDTSTYIVNAEQKRIPVIVSTALLKDSYGKIIGGVETFRDMTLVEELRHELNSQHQLGDMVSHNKKMQDIFAILPQIAETDSNVLIQGETGTGKELMARAIHDLSPRCENPFIAINCGALPDSLLESELFGYKKGAFTGAVRDRAGRFAQAKGGTILLDEIGSTSPAFQVRLLRILQEQKFTPLGKDQPEQADVRVIAATNKDLDKLVDEGSFRQDLFYRINVMRIQLPPLRERKEDIPILVDHFINHLNKTRGKHISGISQEALTLLMSHDYPGNIRELENIIEHAFVLCSTERIKVSSLPENIRPTQTSSQQSMYSTIQTVERQTIFETLKKHNFNRLAAAKELGIHKSTLFRKIKKLRLELPQQDGRSAS